MPIMYLFWIVMLFWLVGGWWSNYTPGTPYPYRIWWPNLLNFIALVILGWQVFGAPVK